MAVSHVYNQTVADGTATSVVRPSDWNSAHNQFLTVSGNTAGSSTMSGTNIVWQGGNNVTLSVSTAAGAATVVVSGANTVAQTVQTQASGNIPRSGLTTGATAGVLMVGTNDTNGISLGVPAWLTTAAQSSASNVSAISAATNNTGGGTATLSGGISFSNANNFTFYTSAGNAIAGSFSTSQSVQTQASGNIPRTGITTGATAGSLLAATHDTNGISLGVPAWLTVAAGGGGFTGGVSTGGNTVGNTGTQTGSLFLAGGNNITLSVGTAAGGAQTVTISGPNTAAQTAFVLSNSNGITFGTNVSTVTASYNSTSAAGTSTGFTGANISGSMTNNSAGLALSLSVAAPGGGGAINVSAGTTSGNLQTIVFSNSNGVSFGLNGSTVTATVAAAGGGVTGSWWQPEVWGSMVSTSLANGTVYLRPFELDAAYDNDMLIFQQSVSSQASSTLSFSASVSAGNASSGSGTYGQTMTAIWFSRVNTNETNASYNSIISFDSDTYSLGQGYSASVSWSTNVSSATASLTTSWGVSFIQNIDGAGNITTGSTGTSGSTTFSSTSTNANSFSSSYILSAPYQHVSGIRPIFFPQAGSNVPGGEYWLGVIQSTATGSTNMSLQRPLSYATVAQVAFTGSTQNSYLEYGNSVNMTTSNYRQGFGSYSASTNTTAAIPLSAISILGSNASIWFAMAGRTK